ncbi:MAG: hypothetical protein IJL04_01495 [Bacteroidales bacterium]|nr:hypothetical protein [Bacteroidales bacterium]MBQ6100946.1 hypothetical protein [Bacteroidales bacterium]
MKTKLFTLLIALLASASMNAQYVVSDKYDLWFEDSGNEVTTRKPEWCTENYQDLRNGCTVRINSNRVYIYYNGSSFLYGDEINLLYNGYYRVKRSGTWYLADPDGDLVSGIYGEHIYYYPWGYVTVQRSSGYWDVYHCSGRKLDFYSDESPLIYSNGCWGVRHGKYWYAYDEDGNQISGVYGDQMTLLNDGRWKCVRGSYVSYVEP